MAARKSQGRDALVERYLPLAEKMARRYAHTKEPFDDLVQVARIGLIKAATRWDPSRGKEFPAYAVPTMLGELRRYLRDAAWAVRPPRGLQDLCLEVERARDDLVQQLGREPTPHDLAALLGSTTEAVREALEAGRAYTAQSLDAPVRSGDEADGTVVADLLADPTYEPERSEDAAIIAHLCADLRPKDREVVRLRYQEDLVQREIGKRLGCSQMQVSRRLREAIDRMQAAAGVA